MQLLLLSASLIGSISIATACSAAERPQVGYEGTVALAELSGLALRETATGYELLAVGDEAFELVVVPIEGGLPVAAKARHIPLPLPRTAGGSDLEGVAVAGDGSVWVLVERGEVYAYDVKDDGARERWHKRIVFSPTHVLAAAWEADVSTRAEGLALVGGRIFIVKQARPAALVELWPDGDRFVASLVSTLSDLDDASELVHAGGSLYVLGPRSGKICRLPIPGEKGPDTLACAATWPLPAIPGHGKARWEGLAFLPDGRPILGLDHKQVARPNLLMLPALGP